MPPVQSRSFICCTCSSATRVPPFSRISPKGTPVVTVQKSCSGWDYQLAESLPASCGRAIIPASPRTAEEQNRFDGRRIWKRIYPPDQDSSSPGQEHCPPYAPL